MVTRCICPNVLMVIAGNPVSECLKNKGMSQGSELEVRAISIVGETYERSEPRAPYGDQGRPDDCPGPRGHRRLRSTVRERRPAVDRPASGYGGIWTGSPLPARRSVCGN